MKQCWALVNENVSSLYLELRLHCWCLYSMVCLVFREVLRGPHYPVDLKIGREPFLVFFLVQKFVGFPRAYFMLKTNMK